MEVEEFFNATNKNSKILSFKDDGLREI